MRLVVALPLFIALTLAGSASAQSAARPTIAVLDRTPVVVRGTAFGPRERVVVTMTSGLRQVIQRTTATYRGSFVVRFDGLRLSGCGGATLVAAGGQGHVARLKLSLRECPGPILDP